MKFLITGSSGQLAKAFINTFNKDSIDYLAPNEQELDITNQSKIANIFTEYKPNFIINCAAYTNVEKAEQDPTTAYLINKTSVSYLTEETKRINAKFIHFSTDYVFDGKKNDFYTESDIPNPLNEYGKTKLAGEEEALKYSNSLVCRLSWVIGNGQQNFLYKLSNWVQEHNTIKVSDDEISVPCFTFDIVKYILIALDNNLNGLYHLTNSSKASRYELALEYARLMNFSNEIVPVPMSTFPSQVKRPLYTAMANKKISKELNINIPDWRESLKLFSAMVKQNEY
ncbi:MAG: dTDP-4-dehydrorhamnose reductase [Endomicrobiaceae bacterium]|nr:dTDP-4-dehydrorhamnose reductase [Endomicrobiaceae bacterium]MDD3922083.1 dTDP-4-dehydrorhamnose reductase [Endomicrobiaceae bacterium]